MITEEINKILNSGKDIQMQSLELQKIGKLIYNELNKPEFQYAFEKSSESLKGKIDSIKNDYIKIENEITKNETLLEQKKKLELDFKELELKQNQLAELKNHNRILNLPENEPSRIINEISKLSDCKEDIIKKHIEKLQNLNYILANANTDLEKQLSTIIHEATNNLISIQSKQNEGLILLDTSPIKNIFIDFSDEVNRLTLEYNLYVDKIKFIKNDLEEISSKHNEVIESFKIHKLENDKIFGALESREGVLNHVNILRNEIEERLLIFDKEIRDLVEKRNQLPIYQLAEIKQYQ
jgi:hypothetical protein